MGWEDERMNGMARTQVAWSTTSDTSDKRNTRDNSKNSNNSKDGTITSLDRGLVP